MKLINKVALITGGGNGIGKAIADLFASQGASIVINDINDKAACETSERIRSIYGVNIEKYCCDISKDKDVKLMIDTIINQFGGIHVLVNNAGGNFSGRVSAVSQPMKVWDKVFNINFRGAFLCCKNAARWMIRQKSGKIVNIASIFGLVGSPRRTAYGPSKAALINLTKCLAIEWGEYNINVNAIAPGYVNTSRMIKLFENGEINKANIIKMSAIHRLSDPIDIANAALFLVSDDASCITGVTLPVDCGLTSGFNFM